MKELKYLELLQNGSIEELKEMLKNDITKNNRVATGGKARVTAVDKLLKLNYKAGRVNLQRPDFYNNMYYFTDSYMALVLNDSAGLEINDNYTYATALYNMIEDKVYNKLYIETSTLLDTIKLKEDYNNSYLGDISYNYKYLDIAVKTLGKDLEIYISEDKKMLKLLNKDNEVAIIMGIIRNVEG